MVSETIKISSKGQLMPSPSLNTHFNEKNMPNWRCPSCLNETLEVIPDSFKSAESSETALGKSEVWFEYNHYQMVFSCLLKCSRKACQEHVAVSGNGWLEEEFNDQMTDRWVDNVFQAKSFYPPLPLFMPPDGCPENIGRQLKKVSALLPVCTSAAINAMRSILESLLDDLGVPREMDSRKGHKTALKLHNRIENFPEELGAYSGAFMALKWLGNHGSHTDKRIRKCHVEDACGVMDALLQNIYKKEADVADKIARINEHYAPKS